MSGPEAKSLADHSALQNLLPYALRTLRREPALAITLGYLLVAMAGIFYNFRFYAKFGIPVLTLSQISDFLVAGIQQPVALLLVLSTFPLCWLFDFFNSRKRRRDFAKRARLAAQPARGRLQRWNLAYLDWRVENLWTTQIAYLVVVLFYGWMFVAFYSDYRAARVLAGDAQAVVIRLNGENQDFASSAPARTWTYLGAVSNYVFVYDGAARRSVILPVNNITRLEPVPIKGATSHVVIAPIP